MFNEIIAGEHLNPFIRMGYMLMPSWNSIYLFLATISLVVLFYLVFVLRAMKKEERKLSANHLFGVFIFLFYLMHVYQVTGLMGFFWGPIGGGGYFIRTERIFLVPFSSSTDIVPYLYNILMMIPLGIFLPMLWQTFHSVKKVAFVGLFLSLIIEIGQLFTIRSTTTDDLMMNTLGAVIGYGIYKIGKKQFFNKLDAAIIDETNRPESFMIKYEGYFCLILSLMGANFIYHPGVASYLPETHQNRVEMKTSNEEDTIEWKQMEGVMAGRILDINKNQLRVHEGMLMEAEEVGLMMATQSDSYVDETEIITVVFSEETIIELITGNWQNPQTTRGTIEDLNVNDTVTFYGYRKGDGFYAEKIVHNKTTLN